MYILTALLLLTPTIAIASDNSEYCDEIAAVIQDAVRHGDLTHREAGQIIGRCSEATFE